MGSLLTYSGISTKVRAMEGRLITDRQFREMCMLDDVQAAVEFLKNHPAYRDLFADLDESELHRSGIEQRLSISLYRDFSKLYRFSNQAQRKFLDLYFMHYEIQIIKRCLRNVLAHQEADINLASFQDFFSHHSKLDPVNLAASENLQAFITNLDGSDYFTLLDRLKDTENPTVFDYEIQLDLLYFQAMWKSTDKLLTKQEQKLLELTFGARLDLLNIQWIYRSKKYYRLNDADIYSLLIPSHHRLKDEQIKGMVGAGSVEEFYTVLRGTYYGHMIADLNEPPDLEGLYRTVLDKIHSDTSRRHPYSIASLNAYLYFKEAEIRKIITVIESIRYGIDASEILSYLKKQ